MADTPTSSDQPNAWAGAECRIPLAVAARPDLPASAKVLLGVIIWHDRSPDGCFAGIRILGREAGIARRQVMRGLQRLEAEGYITIDRYSGRRNQIHALPVPSKAPVPSVAPVHSKAPDQCLLRHQGGAFHDTGPVPSKTPRSEAGKEEGIQEGKVISEAVEVFPEHQSFDLFWQLFVEAGVSLNDRDREKAARLWLHYEPPEHNVIIAWVVAQMKGAWSSAQYTPRPARALESEGWKRQAATRTIPSLAPQESRDAEIDRKFRERMARHGVQH